MAIADYNQAISHEPKEWAWYNIRGVAYALMDQLEKALADFEKADAMGDPSSAEASDMREKIAKRDARQPTATQASPGQTYQSATSSPPGESPSPTQRATTQPEPDATSPTAYKTEYGEDCVKPARQGSRPNSDGSATVYYAEFTNECGFTFKISANTIPLTSRDLRLEVIDYLLPKKGDVLGRRSLECSSRNGAYGCSGRRDFRHEPAQ